MAKNNIIEAIYFLSKYEKKYVNILENREIKILRQVNVSKEELNYISRLINIIFNRDKKVLQNKFPVTLSLFLIWCTVYEYKHGDMWSYIFKKLDLVQTPNNARFLGDIFLDTLNKYELLQIKEGEGKKYFSPIVMHGYISDNYAFDLFSYLNRIYSVVLEEKTDDDSIEAIWEDIFSEDIEFKSIQKEIKSLQDKKEEILYQLKDYKNINDEIKNISYGEVEELEEEVSELIEAVDLNKRTLNGLNKKLDRNININKYTEHLVKSASILSLKVGQGPNKKDLKEIDNLIGDISRIIENQNRELNDKITKLDKENKGLNNKLAIKKEKLISIKSKITMLGQGLLSSGWNVIDEYNGLRKELEIIEEKIRKKEKYENIKLDENTTIKQVLTASLNNLRLTDMGHFKEFVVGTIQMMGKYFSGGQVDRAHPLYEIFIEWTNREAEEKLVPEADSYKLDQTRGDTRGGRLALQSMKKPYIYLDTNKFSLSMVIPQQVFTFRKNIDMEPYYNIIDEDGTSLSIDIDYLYRDKKLHIKETEICFESTSYQYLFFQWYNLREFHDIALDEIMVFNAEGSLLNKDKVQNGYYYIVYREDWFLKNANIVGQDRLLLDNYKITEVYLDESKINLHNPSKNETYSIVATNYELFKFHNYNPVKGIYCEELPVITGSMPELFINYIDIDPASVNLQVFANGNFVYNKDIGNLLNISRCDTEGSLKKINIYELLGLKNTACQINILLSYKDGRIILDESFYFLPGVQFQYIDKALKVKIERGSILFNCVKYEQKGMEYIIPLTNEENKDKRAFSIYYNRYGWVDLEVELAKLTVKIFDDKGKEYSLGSILYGSKKDSLKNISVQWETNSKRIQTILLYDDCFYFETRLHMKNGRASTGLQAYFDVLNETDKAQLYYKAKDENILVDEEVILQIYDKWEVNNIRVDQKEELDEFIIGIEYDENFVYEGIKYLQILNNGNILIEKIIKDQMYLYIKKEDLISNKIEINILYYDEFKSIFGEYKETIIAGATDVELKSKIDEIHRILNKGLIITKFKCNEKTYTITNPISLTNIKISQSKNFEGEEIYVSNILTNGGYQKVYFYIDTERKVLPFLIDGDNDGAQYDPKDGKVFWELSNDKDILAPLEDISYIIKGE